MPNENLIVISVISWKGGVGKSTLSAALASYFDFHGQRVKVIDADLQNSLMTWQRQCIADHRWSNNIEVSAPETAQEVSNQIDECYDTSSADVVIIDTAGIASKATTDIASVSDIILMPTQPSDMVQWSNSETFKWYENLQTRIRNAGGEAPPLTAIMVNLPSRTTVKQRSQLEEQESMFPLAEAQISTKDAYQRLTSDGPFSVQLQIFENMDRKQTLAIQRISDALTELDKLVLEVTGKSFVGGKQHA